MRRFQVGVPSAWWFSHVAVAASLIVGIFMCTPSVISAHVAAHSGLTITQEPEQGCSGNPPPCFGDLLLSASSWLDGKGVNVYDNGYPSYVSDDYNHATTPNGTSVESGLEWQCVELVNRLYITRGWITKTWGGNGNEMYGSAPGVGLTNREAQGSISQLYPGDVVSFDTNTSSDGHVAIVNSLDASGAPQNYPIQFVDQNAPVYIYGSLSGGTLTMDVSWITSVVGVVHSPDTQAITFTSTPPLNPVPSPNIIDATSPPLTAGQELTVNEQLTAANNDYRLVMQGDGNLVEYNSANRALWNSGTEGTGSNNYAALQSDGNFVVYTSAGKAVWSSKTAGTGAGDAMFVQGDGNVVLYSASGAALWNTGTEGFDTYTPEATGGASGNPVTFTIPAVPSPVCTISSGVVTLIGSGLCTIEANQAGNSTYSAAPPIDQTFTVSPANQSITYSSTAPSNATVGGPAYTPAATSTSGLPVTFTLDGTSTGCSLSSGVVSFTSVGTCVIDADQAGTADTPTPGTPSMVAGDYLSVGQYLTSASGGYILFMQADGNLVEYGSAGEALWNAGTEGTGSDNYAALQSDGNFVVYTSAGKAVWKSGTEGTGADNTLILQGDGNLVLYSSSAAPLWSTATAGMGVYNEDLNVQQVIPVGQGSQSITFTSAPPTHAVVGGTYTVAATGGGSGNPVTFSSATPRVCRVSGAEVTFLKAGACTINANQAANTNYSAAPEVQQSFRVRR
jgi:hypothetical protein